jgi:hypothetical protein
LSDIDLLNIEKNFQINFDQAVANFIANKDKRKMIFSKSFFLTDIFFISVIQADEKKANI